MRFIIRYCFVLLGLLFTNCLGIRYLKDGESLLYKQEIEGAEGLSKEEIASLYRQKPNHRFPIPFVWLHQQGLKAYDSAKVLQKIEGIKIKYDKKIAENSDNPRRFSNLNAKRAAKIEAQEKVLEQGNLPMRWGEPLAVFDSLKTSEAREQINRYLHAKGYFHANTDYTIHRKRRKVTVVYNIDEGRPFQVNEISYQTKDTTVARLLKENVEASTLKTGKNYEQSNISKERDRIDILLKNNGYFDFTKQYIFFEVDSLKGNHQLDIKIIINIPFGQNRHKVYYVDSVKFRTDANIVLLNNKRTQENFNNVTYEYFRDRFSKKILDSRLFIYPGQTYSRNNTFNTQRQLANLDMFRFVNINYDTTGGKMVANIFASPLKKFQTSNEIGVGINVTEGFPGPFYNVVFKNRNLFGGLEILEFNGRVGIEGLPVIGGEQRQREIYSSQEISGNFSLTFPQFIVPYGDRIRSNVGTLNPKTRITLGNNYIDRPDYRRNNLNGSIGYSWLKNNKSFVFTLAELGLINSSISDEFRIELDSRGDMGSNLFRSFEPSFVSSMSLLTNINFNSYGLNNNDASLLKIFIESGGTTLNLLSEDRLDDVFNDLEYYKFVKLNIDFRKTLPVSRQSNMAYRVNLGMAKPYARNKILPYEKYFFAGGSNGIRAWRPRRLGPGSYTPLDSLNQYDDRFEQFGEIIIEASWEIRRHLFGFVDGAFFVDAGNIWTFEEEEDREGGKFEFDRFYKEIAIGSGVGLRLDFSFLVLRFDGAFKIYDPARQEGSRFIFSQNFNNKMFDTQDLFVINIGIGYPF